MAVQLITYDLRRPGQDYAGLYVAIQSLGTWWHGVESVWLVETNSSSAQIRNALNAHINANDSLLVANLGGDWATLGLVKDYTEWLRKKLA